MWKIVFAILKNTCYTKKRNREMSNRVNVTNHLISQLKVINGGVSPYDPSYTFSTDIHDNVYKYELFFDEIHDFPSLYVVSPIEDRQYHSTDTTNALIQTIIRIYLQSDDLELAKENIINDIIHVIYNITIPDVNYQLQQITIDSIAKDSGVMDPYGLVEVFLTIQLGLLKI